MNNGEATQQTANSASNSIGSEFNTAMNPKKKNLIDANFPLFMSVFQDAKIPILFVYPFLMMFFFQVLIVSIWPWSVYWEKWEDNGVMTKIRTILFYIPLPAKPLYYMILSASVFVLNLISLLLIRFQLLYYRFQRKFIKFLNYPIRFFFDTILVATLAPCIVGTDETFLRIAHSDKDPLTIVSFVLFILSIIYESYSFIMVQDFASKSISINVSPMLNFDPTIMIRTLTAMLATLLPYFVMLLFETWAPLFPIIIQVIIYVWLLIYMIQHMPFVDPMTQALSIGWFMGCITGDIIMVIANFVPNMHYLIPIIGTFGSFMFFVIVGMIFIFLYVNGIIKKLNENISELNQATIYYDSLGLNKNESKALLYLRIAFQNYSPCFYNLTLLQYIMERYDSETSLATCLHLMIFFPKETRIQDKLERMLMKKRSLSYLTRFLLFQIDAIKSLRQYSTNNTIKLKTLELKNMNRQCEMMARSALDTDNLNANYFETLATKTHQARALWKESLISCPNNSKFCEEYARYLIECECDFAEGIKIKNRQNFIEMGHDFSIDYSFRSLVEAFPKYLTEQIVDFNGGFIKNKEASNKKETESTSHGTNHDGELDDDIEDIVGRKYISHSRLRLALSKMLDSKIPKPIKAIIPVSFLILVYIASVFTIGIQITVSRNAHFIETMDNINMVSEASFFSALSNCIIVLQYLLEKGEFAKYKEEMDKISSKNEVHLINFEQPLLHQLLNFTNLSASSIDDYINILTQQGLEGHNIFEWSAVFVEPHSYMIVCMTGGRPVKNLSVSFATMISQLISNQRWFAMHNSVGDTMKFAEACEITTNFEQYFLSSQRLIANISTNQQNEGKIVKKRFDILAIVGPLATFIVVFIPLFTIHFLSLKAENKIIKLINSFSATQKSEAQNRIMLNQNDDDMKIGDNIGKTRTRIYLMVIILIVAVVFLVLAFIATNLAIETITNLININIWNEFASERFALSCEALNLLTLAITKHDIPTSYNLSPQEKIVQLAKIVADKLFEQDHKLVSGSENSIPCMGYDKELDELNIIDNSIQDADLSQSSYYTNVSIHQQIDIYRNMIYSITQSALKPDPLNPTMVANALYLTNSHLFEKLSQVPKRLLYLADSEYDSLKKDYNILIAVVVISCVIFLLVIYGYYTNRVMAYRASLFIVKRFSPLELANNSLFKEIFLSNSVIDNNSSLEGAIIQNANDAIFCTNLSGIVEVSNKGVFYLFGYTPDQVLGQNVSSFFGKEDYEKITLQLENMKNNQISMYEGDHECTNDAEKLIPVHVTIIGMKSHKDDPINSFVIILRDQTHLLIQKKQAEDAKAQSEKLLYQILPRDIVFKLSKGEKDISFAVPCATIIFIDIDKFSEYTVNLSPHDIMSNLSSYFAFIDRIASQHDMIQKIKLIGDIYMAAAGLFHPNSTPDTHAEQTIKFALECLSSLDEMNIRLGSNIQVRIGINTGGPLIAGVLGTDKPMFDIIGDAINIAARLQSSDEVNKIHVSRSVYEAMRGLSYEFVCRGRTFLKGKGYEETYFVNQATMFVRNTSAFFKIAESVE